MLGLVHALGLTRQAGQRLVDQQPVARGLASRDVVVLRQFGPAHLLLFRQRVIAPAGRNELLLQQGLELHVGFL
ncbi:hypothetical protein D3C85_1826260 [compost metagenome]